MKGVAAKTRNKYQAAFEMIAPLALLYLQFISSRIRNVIPGVLTAIGESHQSRLKNPSSDRAPGAPPCSAAVTGLVSPKKNSKQGAIDRSHERFSGPASKNLYSDSAHCFFRPPWQRTAQ